MGRDKREVFEWKCGRYGATTVVASGIGAGGIIGLGAILAPFTGGVSLFVAAGTAAIGGFATASTVGAFADVGCRP